MAESRWKIVEPPPAEEPKPAESRWKVEDPAEKKRPSEQDLIDAYMKAMQPARAMSRGAATSSSFGLFNRGLGLYDWATGGSPSYSEGVDKAVAEEKGLADKYPGSHLTGSLFGGAATGLGAAKAGFTLAQPGMGLLARSAMGAGEGAGYGMLAGAGNTYTGNPMDYLNNAGDAGKLGLGVGAAAPSVLSALSWAGGKAIQPFNFFRSDHDVAVDRVTKAAMDAAPRRDINGNKVPLTVKDIETDVNSAYAAGQPEYAVVDAIGKPAQRQLAVVAKQEGPARDLADDYLTGRNIGAPARRAGEVDKALGVDGTARQAEAALLERAQTESRPLYESAMAKGPVHNDVIAEGLQHPIMRQGIARGVHIQSVENAMTGRPFNPNDAAITGFNAAGDPIISGVPNMQTLNTAKIGLDQMIEESIQNGRPTNYTRVLTGFKNRLLEQIDGLNPEYGQARRAFSGPMQIRDAVEEGQAAASRTSRFADVLDEFRARDPNSQQGYRIGYADKTNSALESGQIPSNLLPRSQKGQVEFNELSLYQGPNKPTPRGIPEPGADRPPGEGQLRTFMNREDEMARTTQQAIGGSPTAENLADMGATKSAVAKAASSLLRSKPVEAIGHAWEGAKAFGRGETEAQRAEIARLLLLNSGNEAEFAALLRAMQGGEARAAAAAPFPTERARAITGAAVGSSPYVRRK